MKLKSKFAQVARKARGKLKYTQAEVAEKASITPRLYQKIESGLKRTGTVTAMKLMLILQIDIEELRDSDEFMDNYDDDWS